MASLTFGSIGDIIAISDILRKVIQALSESRGSAAEYQALVRELQSLSQAVSSTRLLLEKHPYLKENDRLEALLKDCRDTLSRELEHIAPYRAALESRPTTSVIKTICRKIRWLATKSEQAAFHAAITSHVLALSAVLAISGIDTQYQLHSATVEVLEQGFGELKLASEQSSIAHEAETVRLEDSLQEVKTTLATRHDQSDQQALVHHAEINRKLEALHMTVSKQSENSMAGVNPSAIQNRVYLMLIIKLLTELGSMGLVGAYHFLQLIQLMMSHRALHFFPQSKCLLVEDAILRQFVIDVDLMSYESFTKLIEDKFASTPGAVAVASKQYFFEDKKRHRLSLDGVWSSDILKGKTVFMRARIPTPSLSKNFCPACSRLNEEIETDKEICCICGCRYITTSGISTINPVSSAVQVIPDARQKSAGRAYNDDEVAKFFKRVEKMLQQAYSIPLPVQEPLEPRIVRETSSELPIPELSYDTRRALEELERLKREKDYEDLVQRMEKDLEERETIEWTADEDKSELSYETRRALEELERLKREK